jgi:hypothetical protein
MSHFPELKDDVRAYYEWAERVAPKDEPYGIAFHIFELKRAIRNLNQAINQTIKR